MIPIQIAIIVILIVLSALFSSSETALTTITPHRLRSLVDEEVSHAKVLDKILGQKEKMLSVILICNNIVNLTASALATVVVQKLFGNRAVSIGTGILTLLVLIFGEIVPKTMATKRAEKMGLAVAPVINVLMIVFTPITAAINFLAKGVLFLLGVRSDKKTESYTENEIRSIVEVSHEEGVTTSEEKEIINNVFDFTDTTVKEIMVPRINVVAISINSTYDEIMTLFREEMFKRYPVYDEDGENNVGLINVKDLISLEDKDREHFCVQDILREISYTYEGKHLSELFREMKKKRESIMAVLDEYGDLSGIVTIEDILEELVGEIQDEYDIEEVHEPQWTPDADGWYTLDARTLISDIRDNLDIDLPDSDDYDTIGGYLADVAGRILQANESQTTDLLEIQVLEATPRVVKKIELRPVAEEEKEK